MCEFYWAYANFEDLSGLYGKIFAYLAEKVCGSTLYPLPGRAN